MILLEPIDYSTLKTIKRWKRFLISNPENSAGFISILLGVVAGTTSWLLSNDVLIASIVGWMVTAVSFTAMLCGFSCYSNKHIKLIENDYQTYLKQFDVETLIKNHHSPEHDERTKKLIEAHLNTHHKGWSMGTIHIQTDESEEMLVSRTHDPKVRFGEV